MNDLDFDYDLSGEHQIDLVESKPGKFKYYPKPKPKKKQKELKK